MPGTWEDLISPFPKDLIPLGLRAVHMVHLKNGKILFWGLGTGGPTSFETKARLWDPDNPLVSELVQNDTTNLYCAGHCALTDGRILLAGGSFYVDPPPDPLPPDDVNFFDPDIDPPWRDPPLHMAFRRWYPTCTTLWDGRVLITSGYKQLNETGRPPVAQLTRDRLRVRAICGQYRRLFPTRVCVTLERAEGLETERTEVRHETHESMVA